MPTETLKSPASRRMALMTAIALSLSVMPFGLTGTGLATARAAVPAVQSDTALYRQLMELNGTSRNARLVMTNSRKAILDVIEREKGALSTADRARYDALADAAFASLTEQILNLIASDQAPGFTDAEIRTLIAANTGAAAATYQAAKFKDQEGNAAEVQSYMVDSVLEIIRAFENATPIEYPGPITDEPPRVVQAAILLSKDGTEQIVNHFVGSVHRTLIVNEIGNHIAVESLPEADKVRLNGIVNAAVNKLGNRILLRSARIYGQELTAEQLTSLIAANDNPAQRKLTQLRITGGDAADARSAELLAAVAIELAAAFGVQAS